MSQPNKLELEMTETLSIAQEYLRILERKAAGYGELERPAYLELQLAEKRKEIESLELRLAQLQGSQSPAIVPNNLPPRADVFVGRSAQLGLCLEALSPTSNGWGVIIDGIGGMGKTELALQVAHEALAKAWFDAYLFASAKTTWLETDGVRQETLTLASLDFFVREFARLLKNDEIVRLKDSTERRRALLDALRGRRVLMVWDNLETLSEGERSQITEFLRKLAPPNKAIVTSRHRTSGDVVIRLDRLAERDAFDFIRRAGRKLPRIERELRLVDESTLHALYDATGGNPLALKWTLGLADQRGYTLAKVVEYVRDTTRSRDLYIFLFAQSVQGLDERDRTILSSLSGFHTPTTAEVLAGTIGQLELEVEESLGRLVSLSLVDDLEGGRYSLHPLTRNYINKAIKSTLKDTVTGENVQVRLDPVAQKKTRRYWVEYAQKYGGDNKHYQNFHYLDAEWPNLEATATDLYGLITGSGLLHDSTASSGYTKLPRNSSKPSIDESLLVEEGREAARLLVTLDRALNVFLRYRGYWDERVRLGELAYDAAKALQDWPNAGWSAYETGWIYYLRGEVERAQSWFNRMLRVIELSEVQGGQTVAPYLRGLSAYHAGKSAEAERLWTEALKLSRESAQTEEEMIVLHDLGNVAWRLKKDGQAEDYYHQSLAIAEQIDDKEHQAVCFGSLGKIATKRSRPAEARPFYQRQLELAQALGRQDLVAKAQAGYARALEAERDYSAALRRAEEALNISERLQDRDLEANRRLVMRLRKKTIL
jgi:tetratricopeptide (TPR) repeat protein